MRQRNTFFFVTREGSQVRAVWRSFLKIRSRLRQLRLQADELLLAKPLSTKADRFCYGLKVQLRRKPPEELPAQSRLKPVVFSLPRPGGPTANGPGQAKDV